MTTEWMANALMQEWAHQSAPRSQERLASQGEVATTQELQVVNPPDAGRQPEAHVPGVLPG